MPVETTMPSSARLAAYPPCHHSPSAMHCASPASATGTPGTSSPSAPASGKSRQDAMLTGLTVPAPGVLSNDSDPDGDPLQYRWDQRSGEAIVLRDDDTVEASFISPQVHSDEVLEFSLVVIDSKGATSFPAIVRITVRP